MNPTYLAVTGAIVLATMIVYAFLAWRGQLRKTPDEVAAEQAAEAPHAEMPREQAAPATEEAPARTRAVKRRRAQPRRDPS